MISCALENTTTPVIQLFLNSRYIFLCGVIKTYFLCHCCPWAANGVPLLLVRNPHPFYIPTIQTELVKPTPSLWLPEDPTCVL